jgi:hypothetical protein
MVAGPFQFLGWLVGGKKNDENVASVRACVPLIMVRISPLSLQILLPRPPFWDRGTGSVNKTPYERPTTHRHMRQPPTAD